MDFRRTGAIALMALAVFSASGRASMRTNEPLVLKYTVEEGLNGRVARGATFKAWIDEGRPIVATSDDDGRVVLELGRPLEKGQTLFVEAENAEGDRFYSWVYRDTGLAGHVRTTCQLVGIHDFQTPDVVTARRPK